MGDVDLFAGLFVSDLEQARDWYARLLGSAEAFRPNDVEIVWELAEHRYLYVERVTERPERAGHGQVTLFVEDFDAFVAGAASRGIAPAQRETYDNGVRKWTYRDDDGNEVGLGGGPDGDPDADPDGDPGDGPDGDPAGGPD